MSVLLVLISGCSQLAAAKESTGTYSSQTMNATPSQPIDLAIAVDRNVATLSNLCHWRLVADATVSQVLPGEWKDHLNRVLSIVTPVRLIRTRIFVDHRTGPTSEFVTAGGQVGRDRIRVLGFPQLTPHQRYLLIFATGRGTWLYAFDAFRIDDLQMVSLPEGVDAYGQISYQERKMSLSQLAHLLANCHS
jgi:hypothetical protein